MPKLSCWERRVWGRPAWWRDTSTIGSWSAPIRTWVSADLVPTAVNSSVFTAHPPLREVMIASAKDLNEAVLGVTNVVVMNQLCACFWWYNLITSRLLYVRQRSEGVRQLRFAVLRVSDGLPSAISPTDHRCCFCCQAHPAGRESGHTGNMGELDSCCFCWSVLFAACLTSAVSLSQDTAGSERYEAMSRIYYRGARAAIVCYGQTTETQPPPPTNVSFFTA